MRSRTLQVVTATAMVAVVLAIARSQSASASSGGRCTLVGLNDFAAVHLPTPDNILLAAGPPDEVCHAFYGSGPTAGSVTVQLTKPLVPFAQIDKMCLEAKPPECERVVGVGELAHYSHSGAASGYGSMREVLASVHGLVLAVRAIGMPNPVAKSALVALARHVAMLHR